MRAAVYALTSRISNKIVLPYLVVVICVAVAMTFVTVRLTVGALQERIDNRLIEAGQVTSDTLVAIEDQQLTQLRALVFTQGVAKAMAAKDRQSLATLLSPHWTNARLNSLIVFDRTGQLLLAWESSGSAEAAAPPQDRQLSNLSTWWLVQQIVAERSDGLGDKFSAFHDQHLYTASPVRQNDELVGGVMIGLPIDRLLKQIQTNNQASFTTLYDSTGHIIATTYTAPNDATISTLPTDVLTQLRAVEPPVQPVHIQQSMMLSAREYQIAYSPLQLRRATTGFFSVGVSRQFIMDAWASIRLPLLGLSLVFVGLVITIGLGVSRTITGPLEHLASTARAVAEGELQRRSSVTSRDEIGVVAHAFNQMTQRLLHLYETSRNLSAAIQPGAILTQTNAAIQPFVPGAITLACLQDQRGWRIFLSEPAQDALGFLDQIAIESSPAITALIATAEQPRVAAVTEQVFPGLALPTQFVEACYLALTIQNQAIGLLICLSRTSGTFGEAARMPLTAIASMTATALNNARLYSEIRQEGEQRRVILESIVDGVIVCNADRIVVLMNPAAESLLDVYDWSQRQYHFDELPLLPLTVPGPGVSGNKSQNRYEARGHIFQVTSARLPTADQFNSGEVIVLHDISEEVALNQAKTNLIGMISHELRSPLTAIQGAVDLLRIDMDGKLSELQTQLVETAASQTRAISGMIDKAAIVANAETKKLHLDIQPIELHLALESTIRALSSAANNAQIALYTHLPADLPAVLIDARTLQVALAEVVESAIKYGTGGPIHISACAENTDVMVLVRDEAISMAFEDRQPFLQHLSPDPDAESRGLKLGLAIVRELLERQGGAISVHSGAKGGNLIRMTLPGTSRAIAVQAEA